MYTKGHCGVSLLVYAPIGFGLLLAGYESAAFVGGTTMLGLTMLPDFDHGVPHLDHRGPTHTLLFALLVGALLGAGAATVVPGLGTPLFAFAVGTLAILAHLLADLLTPMGVVPFWPLSTRRYSLQLTPARDARANYVLLGLGLVVTTTGLFVLGVVT